MHMIGHQHIRMDGAAFLQRDFVECRAIVFVVRRGEEARLAIIAALDNMLGNFGNAESGRRGMCVFVLALVASFAAVTRSAQSK